MRIFGREPTLWIGVITSIVLALGTVGFHYLNGQQAGLIVAAILAIAGAANALTVRPIAPAAFTYAVGAIVAVFGAYGLNLSIETVATIDVVVVNTLNLLTRGQVSPLETAVSSS